MVWQKDDTLRRACVYETPHNYLRHSEYQAKRQASCEGLFELAHNLETQTRALVYVASLNGWRPTGYKPSRYSRLEEGHFSLGDEYVDPLSVSSEVEGDKISLSVSVQKGLCRVWQDRPERYAKGPVDEAGDWTANYERDDEGRLLVALSRWDRDAGRQCTHRTLNPAEVEYVAKAEAESKGWLETEAESLVENYFGREWPIDWDTASRLAWETHREMLGWEQRYARHYKEIEALDQLFIAV